MRLFDQLYRTLNGMDFGREFLDKRFKSIDDRLHPLEEQKVTVDTELDRIAKIGVDEVTERLSASTAIINGLSSMGTVLNVRSLSSASIGSGDKKFIVAPDDRSKVPLAGYVTAVPAGVNNVSMSGYISFYSEETGELRVQTAVSEGTGDYSDWFLGLAAANSSPDTGTSELEESIEELEDSVASLETAINASPDEKTLFAYSRYRSV